ncbi:MAG: hypothetical protein K2N05_05050 [Muribaculaceae bacterium]|nr:hypothetical protein [Muribaculaceae bacterium]
MDIKNHTTRNYLWTFLRKYKALAIIFVIIPLILNVACYFSIPFFNNAGSSAWLSFWGGYLGSTIMAGVTLFVLHKQLEQNQFENQQNRKIQNNLMLYQIGYDNLKLFKEAGNYFYRTFSYNNLVEIVNVFRCNSESPIILIKQEFANSVEAERQSQLYMIAEPTKAYLNLISEQGRVISYYNTVLLDIEVITSYLNLSSTYIRQNILIDKHSSPVLKEIIAKEFQQLNDEKPKAWLDSLLEKRLDVVDPKFLDKTWDLITKVYLDETLRLKTLLQSEGTDK